jgi:demethoxyubiquinone hydroxylase (CLK1/Coq7/Cat5 family)
MPFLILNFVKNLTWKGWLAVAAVAVITAILSTMAVNKVIDHFSDNKQVQVNNEDRELREELSVKREDTNTKINTEERQTNEVLAKLPDEKPSARRLARACDELRRNGGHEPLPVACRSATN